MTILGPTTAHDFLHDYWQRRPLLVRGALAHSQHLLEGDDLAGLACEQAVESRIVIHDAVADDWHCEHGPFQAPRFASLPQRGWTVLVQGVEQWIPDLAEVLARFDFLPRWRVDDIMASYAVDGGGVGPHFDYYDVFLIQARGRRRWRLGQRCDDRSALREHPSLRLLARFSEQACHQLDAGDMLYLPPGVAHYGNAQGDDCITLSVGFRAPSKSDILQGMAARLAEDLGEQHRYTDQADCIDADPFLINSAALAQLKAMFQSLPEGDIEGALAETFGRQVTESRQPQLCAEAASLPPAALESLLSAGGGLALRRNPSSRFAYTEVLGRTLLFVDGESHVTTPPLARAICEGHVDSRTLDDAARRLLHQLLRQGSLQPT